MMRKVTKCWRMKGGGKVRICDMTDRHLRNAMLYLERYAVVRREAALFEAEALSRLFTGEAALWDIEWNLDALLDDSDDEAGEDFFPDVYYALVCEVERRAFRDQVWGAGT